MPAFGQPTGDYQHPSGGYQQQAADYEPPAASYETEQPTFPQPTGQRRSAEMARSRLSGFQLGNRDAQSRPPRAGED
jgi:hypothetical protein